MRHGLLHAGGALAATVFYAIWPLRYPLLQPDSVSYIEASPFRPAGYPNLLAGLRALGFAPEQIIWPQLAAMCFSAAFLGWTVARVTQRWPLGIAILAAIVLDQGLMRYGFTVLAEAFSLSMVAVLIGAVLMYGQESRLRWLVLASVAAAEAVMLRYAAIGLFVSLLVPLFWGYGRWQKRAAAVTLPAICVVLGNLWLSQTPASAKLDIPVWQHNLVGIVGLWAKKGDSARQPTFVDALVAGLEPYHTARASLPDWRERQSLDMTVADHLRYRLLPPLLKQMEHPDVVVKEAMLDIAKAHPGAILQHVIVQLASFWYLSETRTPSEYAALQSRAIPDELRPPSGQAAPVGLVLRRLLMALILAAGLLLAWAALRHALNGRDMPPILVGGLTAAVSVHLLLLVPAMLQFAVPRYAIPAWPGMVACIALAVAMLWKPREGRHGKA